jgi:predicted nucleic acid-binding protein
VSLFILLDTGILGLVSNPKSSEQSTACSLWLQKQILFGNVAVIPEIADYELRRELLRADKTKGIASLNKLVELFLYLPISTSAMRKAAALWAKARQQGQPTAGNNTIDGDIILAAQAITMADSHLVSQGSDFVIATTNVGHLSRFVAAKLWQQI